LRFAAASIARGADARPPKSGGAPGRRAPERDVRLAGHTYAFRALPLKGALEQLVGLGFHDVELWLGHARENPVEAASVVERAGVRVRAVSAGGLYDSRDDTPVRAFALAAALDADVVVMCVAPQLVPKLDRLAPPRVRVAVENHWDQPLARSREVVAALRTSRLHACLDTGHALAAGERPDDFALGLGSRLAHVHLKEGRLPTSRERLLGRRLRHRLLGRPEAVAPGDGDLDIPVLRAALARVGFDGCVTVEHEGESPHEALALLAERWREPTPPR
jgi:sugar phosphate isomerase/epimerase